MANLKSLSFIFWLLEVIFMISTFHTPNLIGNLLKNLLKNFIFWKNIYLKFIQKTYWKSKLTICCHDISILFTTLLIKYIPLFFFSINSVHTHSTFCSDFFYPFWYGRVILFEYLNIKLRVLFSCIFIQASNKGSAQS